MKIYNIIKRMEELGFSIFKSDEKDYNLNIVGIRKEIAPNKFNDLLCVFWWYNGCLNTRYYNITTKPGLDGLIKPKNKKGVAILKHDEQYKSSYTLGKHRNNYTALVQRKGKVKVYRDNNKDTIYDFDDKNIDEGYFGINIHRASLYFTDKILESLSVGPYSEGCQVFAYPDEFEEFIGLCKRSSKLWGNSFTYTLLKMN